MIAWLRRPQRAWLRFLLAVVVSWLVVEGIDRLFPPPLAKGDVVSGVVTDRRGAALRVFPVGEGEWRLKADLDAIDPKFVEALLAYEDARFHTHGGVDMLALGRAAGSLVSSGRIVSGGSTLTMQTARLLEPKRRTLGGKFVEMVRAWQIERRLSKREILELYLTLAPYGGNLQGVRAASWAYFGKEPVNLAPDQIALLIALPQSPEARRPDRHPERAIRARSRVLDRLASRKVFDAALAQEAADYPAPQRRPFPALAWHAAEEALARHPEGGDIASTLDLGLQLELEDLARRTAGDPGLNVQAAIMVVEIPTRAVRASVGSADRERAGGWIDLTNRPRSPGSTLKPFIFGMAFDDGLAAGGTRIADIPRRFATYRPDNFDRTFRGDVTVAEALQHSLNVPAVAALDAVGAKRFAAALKFAGADLSMPLDASDETGLAIALGGAGLTVREVVMLYAALGDAGRARSLAWLEREATPAAGASGVQIMSPESAGEIIEILRKAPMPEGRMPASLTIAAPQIAFKTGTSYGFRDAWAAGVSGDYAVAVWIGRADGAARHGATGREAALPALFEAFDTIERLTPSRESRSQPEESLRSGRLASPLRSFDRDTAPPQIIFPPDGAEMWLDKPDRQFVFAAESRSRITWYVNGEPVSRNDVGDSVWTPPEPGFYTVNAIDSEGRSTRAKVRVVTSLD